MTPNDYDQQRYKLNLKTLRVLLIISFIYTGMWALFHFFWGLTGSEDRTAMMEVYQAMAEKNEKYSAFAIMFEQLFAVPQWYYLFCGLLDAISFAGLLLMWRLRKNGFHCYALAKLLLMIMPLLFLDRSYVGLGDMMMAIMFIACYFFLMKALGAFAGSTVRPDTTSSSDTSGD